MNTTYTYLPGPENICMSCAGFIRWPDGKRLICECSNRAPMTPNPEHRYWKEVPYNDAKPPTKRPN